MKVIGNENNITIYINKSNLKFNLDDKEELENYFKGIFIKVKEFYNVKLNGFYITHAYIDDKYGIIIDMERDDVDFIYYNDYEIEMQLVVSDIDFLYEINDIFLNKDIYSKVDIYTYKNKYYLKLKEDILKDIIEYSNIIYKNTENIVKYGKLLKIL